MGKNSQLHLVIETTLYNKLKIKSENMGISLSEFCRIALRDNTQLDRIEGKIDMLIGELNRLHLRI